MGDLPQGTVTFLFTDIEGSTRLLQELGDRYTDVLLEHRKTLRSVWIRNHGVEVGTEGDSFFVAFSKATDAAAAARQAQEALAGGPVKVRMGLHTGEPLVVDDDYVGIDVHRAARISSTAHGGQVVVSERTRSFLRDDADLRDLGLYRLKDLTAPEKLFQLGPGTFPPLRSLNATNLPTQPSPLIGRQREIEDLTNLATERRIVTLTGPGGTGKTRLALQVGAELVDYFADGVFWVSLASVTDPELVLPAIAAALGTDRPVAEYIGAKRMLAVLDNLEQVLNAAPHLATLLRSCPNLCLLVTSRAPLRIEGEREYPVDPLPEDDAVALFRERAFNAEPLEVVAQICRRLDNLPLAVELAAARTRIFSPAQLLERLEHALPLLTGGRRDTPDRHRELRATIEWSYDLLEPDVQRLFEKLGVFAGSCELEAAEQITAATVDGLESLVESSLVRHADDRFTMLETIREYAVERLEASGRAAPARERHARFFLALAERGAAEIESPEVGEWLRRFRLDEDNIRAAIAWALRIGAAEAALRLCIAMTDAWHMNSHIEEGLRWFERALGGAKDLDPGLRARALTHSGDLLLYANRTQESIDRLEAGVALWRTLGDLNGLADGLLSLGASLTGEDRARACEVLEEALDVSTQTNNRLGEYRVLHLLGEMIRDEGDHAQAASLLERAIEIAREIGARTRVGGTTHSLADLELDRGNLDRAEALYRETLRDAVALGLERHKTYCVAGLASIAALRGDGERAARLWQAVEHAEAALDFRLIAYERARYERCLEGISPWTGEALDLDDAAQLALG